MEPPPLFIILLEAMCAIKNLKIYIRFFSEAFSGISIIMCESPNGQVVNPALS